MTKKSIYGIFPEGFLRIAQVTISNPDKYDKPIKGDPSSVLPKPHQIYQVEDSAWTEDDLEEFNKSSQEYPDFDSMSDEEMDEWLANQPDQPEDTSSEPQEELLYTASDLGQDLASKYDIQLSMSDSGGGIVINKIVVPEDAQGSGIGSSVMEEIISYADERGLAIALTPDDTYGGDVRRLEEFYKRFGFIPNTGRNKDYSFMESMVRPAQ